MRIQLLRIVHLTFTVTLCQRLLPTISKQSCCKPLGSRTTQSPRPIPYLSFFTISLCEVHLDKRGFRFRKPGLPLMNIFQTWHSSMQMMGRVSGEQRRQSRRISLTCNQVAEQVPRSEVDKICKLLSRNIFGQFKFHKTCFQSGSPTYKKGGEPDYTAL